MENRKVERGQREQKRDQGQGEAGGAGFVWSGRRERRGWRFIVDGRRQNGFCGDEYRDSELCRVADTESASGGLALNRHCRFAGRVVNDLKCRPFQLRESGASLAQSFLCTPRSGEGLPRRRLQQCIGDFARRKCALVELVLPVVGGIGQGRDRLDVDADLNTAGAGICFDGSRLRNGFSLRGLRGRRGVRFNAEHAAEVPEGCGLLHAGLCHSKPMPQPRFKPDTAERPLQHCTETSSGGDLRFVFAAEAGDEFFQRLNVHWRQYPLAQSEHT